MVCPCKDTKKMGYGAKIVHASMEEHSCEQHKGLDGTCGGGLAVTSLTKSDRGKEEGKAEPSFCDFFLPTTVDRGTD